MVPLPRLINTVVPIIIQNVARERSLCHRIPKNKDADVHSCCSLKQLSACLQIPYSKNLASPFPLIIISCQVSKLQWNEAKKLFQASIDWGIETNMTWNLMQMLRASTFPSPVALWWAPPVVPNTAGSKVLWNTLKVLAWAKLTKRSGSRTAILIARAPLLKCDVVTIHKILIIAGGMHN